MWKLQRLTCLSSSSISRGFGSRGMERKGREGMGRYSALGLARAVAWGRLTAKWSQMESSAIQVESGV